MNENFLEGLAALFLPKKQIPEFLEKLKNGENEEFLSDEELLLKFKGIAEKRLKSKEAYGRKQRWDELAGILRSDYELEFDENTEAAAAIKLLVEATKTSVEPSQVEKIVEAELTKENALQNPIVQELLNNAKRKAADNKKEEMQKVIDVLKSQLSEKEQKESDQLLMKAIRKIASLDKYKFEEGKEESGIETLKLIAQTKGGKFIADPDKRFGTDPDELYLADSNGNIVVDDFGEATALRTFVKTHSPFRQHQFDRSKSSPAPSSTQQRQTPRRDDNPYTFDVTKPNDFITAFRTERDPDKKKQMKEAWEAAKQAVA